MEFQAKLTTKVEILSATMRRAQTNSTDSLTDSSSAQSEQGLAVGFDLDYITSMVDDRINAAHDLNVRPLLNDLADSGMKAATCGFFVTTILYLFLFCFQLLR
jgi:hypothetical protein